jgi:filamentous hemagglutinin family protein
LLVVSLCTSHHARAQNAPARVLRPHVQLPITNPAYPMHNHGAASTSSLAGDNALGLITSLSGPTTGSVIVDTQFPSDAPPTLSTTIPLRSGIYTINAPTVTTPGYGYVAGNNWFNSFQRFIVAQNETALFATSGQPIQNIVLRVVGNQPTTIDGIVTSDNLSVNFWFVNPNGIAMGPTGQINVNGTIGLEQGCR